jgi:TRAP-type mannitol/chloroaromatic compound transport system permease small subunit
VEAGERIKALEAKRDVLIAESNTPWTNVFRACFLVPTAFYYAWTVAWDKIGCKWVYGANVCETDPLSPWQMNILMIIIGYLFITDITKILKR